MPKSNKYKIIETEFNNSKDAEQLDVSLMMIELLQQIEINTRK